MMKRTFVFLLCFIALSSQAQLPAADHEKVGGGELTIQPINHATMVLTYNGKKIFVDPVGNDTTFSHIGTPDIILVTDIHGDHMDLNMLSSLSALEVRLIVPQAVADKLPNSIDRKAVVVLKNGEKTEQDGISITAVPMYNLPETSDAFHTKGRGNGYILTIGGKNIYISGDTEDIPEMRALKNIDFAFVCMNLPYTMDVAQAAKGVLAFKPKVVYPYHYRGQDVAVFKKLVNEGDKDIDVRLRNWYPDAK